MRQHGLQAAAEVAEVVSVLVDLHSLSVVLDLRVHPVGTFLHGHLDGLARLGLRHQKENYFIPVHVKSNDSLTFGFSLKGQSHAV